MPKKSKKKAPLAPQPETSAPLPSLKEQLAEKRKATKAKKELSQFLTLAIGVSVLVGMMAAIVGGVKGAVGGFAGVLILMVSFKYPWQALYAFWIYLPLGGTMTYAIGGGSNPVLQLAKDAFYLPALITVIQTCRQKRLPFVLPVQLKTPLMALLIYCGFVLLAVNGAQQLSPGGDKPLAMGILGLKVFLGYVPLISCAYYLLNRRKDFYFFMRVTTGLIVLCCSLAFIQYMLLKTGRCQGTVGSGAEL
ncbi:MAG: hypothetical protein VKJ24_11640, partial [Synechococcales bacterium]|nr:hypothetical protein [Synechococcales bacterium]